MFKIKVCKPTHHQFYDSRTNPTHDSTICVGIAVLSPNIVTLIMRPNISHLLTSIIPDFGAVHKWKLTPIALIQCYIWCTQWSAIYMHTTVWIARVRIVQHALEVRKLLHQSDFSCLIINYQN